ncbi:MAG: DUF6638 family protein [Gilvibacter sp.]
MEKLVKAGLHGGELVPISGSLVQRYNDCLALLGVAPTELKEFHVDGIGWSPEVSNEKKENYYLNIGDANANGIIISPDQFEKAIYMPFHSFDKDLMYAVFTAYKKEIKDITKDSAICLHIDQDVDSYYETFDLLKVDSIEVHFVIVGDLDKHKKEQEALIAEYHEGNNFFNREIHKKILTSAKKYGDLRNRTLSLEPVTLEVSSFYTRAYGGVFVLRDFIKDMLVFEELDAFNKSIGNTTHDVMMFHIGHEELQQTLRDHLIAECNLKRVMTKPRYERIKKNLFVSLLKDQKHPLGEVLSNPILYKRYFNSLSEEERKLVNGVEIYNEKIALSNEYKRKDLVDNRFYVALHKPHSSLEDEHRDLVWKLLVKMSPLDPVFTFWFDKEHFYNAYESWEDSLQEWVIAQILKHRNKESL